MQRGGGREERKERVRLKRIPTYLPTRREERLEGGKEGGASEVKRGMRP